MKKALVIGVILLFLGVITVSSTENKIENSQEYRYIPGSVDISEGLLSHGTLAYLIEYKESYSTIVEWEIGGGWLLMGDINGTYRGGTWTNAKKIVACERGSNKLYGIYPGNSEREYIGKTVELLDLAYDSSNDIMWGISSNNFYTVNISDGNATLIGSMGNPGLMCSIEYDQDENKMYGLEAGWDSYLYSINTTTGKATQIGSIGFTITYGDMGYDNNEDIMYCLLFNYDSFSVEFHTINLTTGDATLKAKTRYFIVPSFIVTFNYLKLHPVAYFNWTPTKPAPEEIVIFNASESYDPDGNIILYEWDWNNDGVFDENHTTPIATYSWTKEGHYPVTLRVTDNGLWTSKKTKTIIIDNEPPNPPIINGPTGGRPGIEYTYTFVSIDPNGQDIKYYIDWGDGNKGWTEKYYPSGEEISFSHTWKKKGTYTIISQSIDSLGYKSPYSTLNVRMPRDKQIICISGWYEHFPLLFRLLNFIRWNIE